MSSHQVVYFFLIIVIIVLIALTYHYSRPEPAQPQVYRLAGQRNEGVCSPSDEDIKLTMTPSTGLPETITVKDGETFMFAREFQTGDSYEVEQKGSVSGMTCTISNPTGTFVTDDIVNISVSCVSDAKYTIGGTYDTDAAITISAIINPSLSSEETITVDVLSGTGNFVFAETYPSGTVYEIQHPTDDWDVTNGTGVIQCANVTDVDVDYTSPA